MAGDVGVNLVASIVSDNLKWLFRRNHNESDFGIDGYIDIIEADGSVSGRCLAVQIKFGDSYLKAKTDYGYTFYGQSKHLNYLLNHPVPVLIVLCDPASRTCYWEHLDLTKTEPTQSGWKMCIPFEQTLCSGAQTSLKAIAGPVIDYTTQLQDYWSINHLVKQDFDFILYAINRSDIENQEYSNVTAFFNRFRATKTLAKKMQAKIDISISGYEFDRRELWQIPEVTLWFHKVEPQVKYWFYFLTADQLAGGLTLLTFCRCKARWLGRPSKIAEQSGGMVDMNGNLFGKFLERNYGWLNEISEWLNLSMEDNKKISLSVARRLGYPN